jgi:hypothetical protein
MHDNSVINKSNMEDAKIKRKIEMHQEKAEMRKMMKMIKKNLDNPKHNPIL